MCVCVCVCVCVHRQRQSVYSCDMFALQALTYIFSFFTECSIYVCVCVCVCVCVFMRTYIYA